MSLAQAAPKKEVPIFPFDPDTVPKQAWDVMILFMLLYTTFSVPYLLAFGEWSPGSLMVRGEPDHAEWGPLAIFHLLLDVIFCLDIVVTFCTAYTARGVYVTNMRHISANYLRTWFFIDFMGSVPFDKIFAAMVIEKDAQTRDVLQGLRMVRILKAVRAFRFLNKLANLEQRDTYGIFRGFVSVFRAVFVMVFVAHFLACAFFMSIDPSSSRNWMAAYEPILLDYFQHGPHERYVAAFYWAVTTISTIGYGDIIPTNHGERILTLIAGLVGGVAFAFALGNITALIQDGTSVNKQFDKKLNHLKQYLEFRVHDKEFQRKVLTYFGGSWRRSGKLYDEDNILSELPREIRQTLMQTVGREVCGKLTFLKGLDDLVVGDLFIRLMPVAFEEGEVIYRAYETGEELYLIEAGTASLARVARWPDTARADDSLHGRRGESRDGGGLGGVGEVVLAGPGDVFGEVAIFPDICRFRYDTATVVTSVFKAFMLSRPSFAELEQLHPAFCLKMRELCELTAAVAGVSNEAMQRAGGSTPHRSNLEHMIAKHKLSLLAFHERAMQDAIASTQQLASTQLAATPTAATPRAATGAGAEAGAGWEASNPVQLPRMGQTHKRTGSVAAINNHVFRGWLRVAGDAVGDWERETERELASAVDRPDFPRASPRTHAAAFGGGGGGGGSVTRTRRARGSAWLRVSLAILDTGEVLCVDDSLDGLVSAGPQNLGRLTTVAATGEACCCENLEPQDVIDGMRVKCCSIGIYPPASEESSGEEEGHERACASERELMKGAMLRRLWWAAAHQDGDGVLVMAIGLSVQDAKRFSDRVQDRVRASHAMRPPAALRMRMNGGLADFHDLDRHNERNGSTRSGTGRRAGRVMEVGWCQVPCWREVGWCQVPCWREVGWCQVPCWRSEV